MEKKREREDVREMKECGWKRRGKRYTKEVAKCKQKVNRERERKKREREKRKKKE